MTSTFSEDLSGTLIQQLWQAGLGARPAVFLCWYLVAKYLQLLKNLLTFLIGTVQEKQSIPLCLLSTGLTKSHLRKVFCIQECSI